MKRIVFFDLDGVLVDGFSAHLSSINQALSEKGLRKMSEKEFEDMYGVSVENILKSHTGFEKVDSLVRDYEKKYEKNVSLNKQMIGAEKLLRQLKKRGFLTTTASNNSRRVIKAVLKNTGLLKHFDGIMGADQVEKPKPSPDILLAGLAKFGVGQKNAYFVGDTEYDAEAGEKAGVKTIIVLDRYSQIEKIRKHSPYRVVEKLSEALDAIPV